MFQSTHPYRVRLQEQQKYNRDVMFQSTHPHRVRQFKRKFTIRSISVSIHAPT